LARKSIDLATSTDPQWVEVVLNDFDTFLADHANCERKASAMAMGMVVKYPDRDRIIAGLINVAREELDHYAEVHQVMAARGVALSRDKPDAYVAALMDLARHGRDERFLDRMLIASVVECRGAERFGLIAENIRDANLSTFYARLRNGELKHGHVFVDFALHYVDTETVYARLQEFVNAEAEIISDVPFRPALH
jgi:tRNA 2-(methylsulfanyl)-N6-isopentenyladenosine37 hydroxylase